MLMWRLAGFYMMQNIRRQWVKVMISLSIINIILIDVILVNFQEIVFAPTSFLIL